MRLKLCELIAMYHELHISDYKKYIIRGIDYINYCYYKKYMFSTV